MRALERRHEEGLSLDINSVASFFVSRVDTNVDRKLEEFGRDRARGQGRGRERPRRVPAVQGDLLRAALGGAPPAGAAVQRPLWASTSTKNPHYPDTMYVDELVGPHTVNTMPLNTLLAFADHGEVTGPTAEVDPAADLRRSPTPGSTWIRSPRSCWRTGSSSSSTRSIGCWRGSRSGARRSLTGRPTTIQARLPERARGPGRRARQAGGRRQGRGARVAPRSVAVGRPGRPGDRGPARMADGLRDDARARARAGRVRGAGAGGRVHGCGAARDGGLVARPRGDAAVVRRDPERTAPAGARLDAPGRDQGRRGLGRPGGDAVHRLLEIGRDDRDALALPVLQVARRAEPVRRGHRPRKPARADRRRRRAPARVPQPARHRWALLGPVAVRAGAGGADGRQHRGAAASLPGRRAELRPLRLLREQLRAVARGRDRRAGPPGPRQADVHRLGADRELRPVGRAAGRRVDRQARPRDPAGRRRAARRAGRVRAGPRVRVPAQRRPARRADSTRRSSSSRRPASRR